MEKDQESSLTLTMHIVTEFSNLKTQVNIMKKWKQYIALLTVSAMLSNGSTEAIEYCTDTGGCAYEEAYESCCIAPAIAFALIAIAGIIAVGVHNRGDGGSSSIHAHDL